MPLVRAELESLLRARKLDRTLTTFRVPAALGGNTDEYVTASTGVTVLDAQLGGGFPRGQISEIVGVRSSGRASVLLQLVAAATARHEIVALIDVLDMLDVASADAAGVDLGRLLWIRGQLRGGGLPNAAAALGTPGGPGVVNVPNPGRDMHQRALDRAIKALTLVLQAGNFGVVAFDAAEAPPHALQRLPFTTWRRLQCIIEGSQTACVLVGDTPIARSAGGVTVRLSRAGGAGGAGRAGGVRVDGRLFKGLDVELDVIRARARRQENVRVSLSTACR